MTESNPLLAFVCSTSYHDTGGVFSYSVDVEAQTLERLDVTEAESPKFMAIDTDRHRLYTANHAGGGRITAYSYDEEGDLTELNSRPSGGENPCYVTLDQTGDYLLVSNYTGGSVAMLPITPDGELETPSDIVDHEGSSVDPDRQQEPHPHSIQPGPTNRFAYAPDLGTDRVEIYRLDLEDGTLAEPETSYAELHDGAGPRHFDVHPNGQQFYVINELDSTLTVFDYDSETGALEEMETLPTLPEGYDGTNYPADIHVHPSGEWIFGSNRGHNSTAIFEADESGSELRLSGHESTSGEWPRHFALGPDGETLFVENQKSDTIVPFDVGADGQLTPWPSTESVTEPMCMVFVTPT